RRQWLRKPVGERTPRRTRALPVDARLGVAATVGSIGARARGDVPKLGIVRVDGDRPGVIAVAPLVSRPPTLAAVLAEGGSTAASLVRPAVDTRMPGKRVDVPLRPGAVVLPGRAAIDRAHHAAQFAPDQHHIRLVRARR